MDDITKKQLETKDIEWYKKELAAMSRIVHVMTKDRELLKKKLITMQTHEEIKQKAWDLSKIFLGHPPIINKKQLVKSKDIILFCWCRAEEFYKFAKAKEKATLDQIKKYIEAEKAGEK
jgi:hypothetical protein